MAPSKSRLGRGLDTLIAGGAGKAPARPATPPPPAPKAPARPAATPAKAPVPAKASPAKPAPAAAPAPKANPPAKSAPVAAPVAPPPAVETPAARPSPWQEIPVADVVPNPFQPRREFNPESIKELADSIASEGLLQPVLVRRVEGKYQLIAGERRFRAVQLLRHRVIPAKVIEAKDSSSAVMALIENLQRADLNPLEEAQGYASLMRDFDLTQEAVAERVGKSRPAVANALRLLLLSKESRSFLAKGQLSVGHAKVLLGIEDVDLRDVLARRVVQEGLSVRQTTELVERSRAPRTQPGEPPARPTPRLEEQAVRDIEKRLTSKLNTKVQVLHTPKKGRLVIEYYGNDDLQRLLDAIGLGS